MYFVDARNRIRHHQFGEGGYERSERVIQQLLVEAGQGSVSRELVSVVPAGPEAAADWGNLKSPETYLGYERSDSFASVGKALLNKRHNYAARDSLRLNEWALTGDWTVGRDSVVVNTADGRVLYRFHARDVNLIMAPPDTGAARFRVLIDRQPPGADHGSDVDDQGYGTVTEPRMYQLIRQAGPITDRQIDIQFLEPGAVAFDFTFG